MSEAPTYEVGDVVTRFVRNKYTNKITDQSAVTIAQVSEDEVIAGGEHFVPVGGVDPIWRRRWKPFTAAEVYLRPQGSQP